MLSKGVVFLCCEGSDYLFLSLQEYYERFEFYYSS